MSQGKRFTTEEARADRRRIAEYLLAAGADVNSEARVMQFTIIMSLTYHNSLQNGWTPIMQASQDGDVKMVKILTRVESLEVNHASKVSE